MTVNKKIERRPAPVGALSSVHQWQSQTAQSLVVPTPFDVEPNDGDILPGPQEDRFFATLSKGVANAVYFLTNAAPVTLGAPAIRDGQFDGQTLHLSPTTATVTLPAGSNIRGTTPLIVNVGGDLSMIWDDVDKIWSIEGGAGGSSTVAVFTDLTDTPADYTGQALLLAQVNAAETGLQFSNTLESELNIQVPASDGTAILNFLDEVAAVRLKIEYSDLVNTNVIESAVSMTVETLSGTLFLEGGSNVNINADSGNVSLNATVGDIVFIATPRPFSDGGVDIGSDSFKFATVFANRVGAGIAPVSPLHVYEDTTFTGATAGSTTEQDGTGDAVHHFILTGLETWTIGVDNSLGDQFAIAAGTGLDAAAHVQLLPSGETGFNKTPRANHCVDIDTLTNTVVGLYDTKDVTIEQGNNVNNNSTDFFFNRADAGFNQSEFHLFNGNNNVDTRRLFYMNFTDAGTTGGFSVRYSGFAAVGISENDEADTLLHLRSDGADTVAVQTWETTGTNGGKIAILVGDQDPTGNVTGSPGQLYGREGGTSSGVFLHKGSSADNTSWKEIQTTALAVDSAITFGDGSTQHVAATQDGFGWHVNTLVKGDVFNVNTQDTNPQGVVFRPDGLKLYVSGTTGDAVYEFDLGTAWNITTAVVSANTLDLSSEDNSPRGIAFRPDGLVIYVIGNENDAVFQYILTTAWDISTAAIDTSVSVSGQTVLPQDLHFKPDGLAFYLTDNTNDDVHRYNMTTPWDLGTASYSGDFFNAVDVSSPSGLAFKPDGTIMYVGGSSLDRLVEYGLTTPWDVTTAYLVKLFELSIGIGGAGATPLGFYLRNDGAKLYFASNRSGTDNEVIELELGLAFSGRVEYQGTLTDLGILNGLGATSYLDGTMQGHGTIPDGLMGGIAGINELATFDVSTEETDPSAVAFSVDGLKMYVAGDTGGDVNEYDLSPAWDASSAVINQTFSTGVDPDPTAMFFRSDGLRMYIIGSLTISVVEFALSTAWDISTAVQVASFSLNVADMLPEGISFSPDGLNFFVSDRFAETVRRWVLTDPWEVDSATITSDSIPVDTGNRGVAFRSDGKKMYVVAGEPDNVLEYDLDMAWDITSAVLFRTVTLPGVGTMRDIYLRADAKKFYVVDNTNTTVIELDLGASVKSVTSGEDNSPVTILKPTTGNDTTAVVALSNLGTNPGTVQTFVGDRDPTGLVTGSPGDTYRRSSGTSSSVFIHQGAAADTASWNKLDTNVANTNLTLDTSRVLQLDGNPFVILDGAQVLFAVSAGQSILEFGDSRFQADADGLQLDFGVADHFEIDGDEGTSLQVFTSNGPNLPPTWESASSTQVTFAALLAIASPSAGDMRFVTDAQVQANFTYNATFGKWTAPEYNIINNNAGGALVQGDVVQIDNDVDFSVETTAIEANPEIIGVVVVGGADSTDVLIKYAGEVLVNKIAGAITRDEFIFSSTTAGSADWAGTGGVGDFGIALENTSATQVRMLFVAAMTD